MRYDHIAIIFNPESSGNAPQMARELAVKLARTESGKNSDIRRYETEHAGHGRELARTIAERFSVPLIISVSGDGGYHDVINGVQDARREKGDIVQAVTTVVPAGNANDHHRAVHDRALEEIIDAAEPTLIDGIEVIISEAGKIQYHVAHSYVGFGVTARAAKKINRLHTNLWQEAIIVWQTIQYFPGLNLTLNDQPGVYDSVIAANINEMAKVVTVAPDLKVQDGRFELVVVPHLSRWRFYLRLSRAIIWHESDPKSISKVSINLRQSADMQLDGETITCAAGAMVEWRALKQKMRVLV